MKGPFRQNQEVDSAISPAVSLSSARDRVLEVACEMFAEAGFHGTHLREICKRAETNVAGVCYHFRSKDGLFEAVSMEAGRRLAEPDGNLLALQDLPPDQRLLKIVESLLQRLGVQRAWIAKLLTRELVDPASEEHNYVASGLGRDFILLQRVMRDVLGANASSEAIRLHALNVIGECVFVCLAGETQNRALAQLGLCLPSRARLARLITQRSFGALEREQKEPEVSHT